MPRASNSLAATLFAASAALLFAGCTENGAATSPGPAPATTQAASAPAAAAEPASGDVVTAEVRKEAQEIFSSRCTPCHGPAGAGDGPASAGLTPPPRNLQDPAWQTSVTDQHIETIIQYGGAAVGRSAAMPPNPDLADKPVVKGLREHIRSLKK